MHVRKILNETSEKSSMKYLKILNETSEKSSMKHPKKYKCCNAYDMLR